MRKWQLQEAKNKFSQLTRRALSEGPQMVTKRGKDCVIVVNAEDYTKDCSPENSLVDFLRHSPLAEVELEVFRSTDKGREVEL